MTGGRPLASPGLVIATAAPGSLQQQRAREVFERFVDLLFHRQQVRAAFESCVAREGFVDHGGFRSRAAAMAALAPALGRTGRPLKVLHTAFDGEIGMVHLVPAEAAADGSTAAPAGAARVEIFRVAGDRITEHWSVGGGGA